MIVMMKNPNQPQPRRGQAGFTLVELLVVIVIIAVLMALLIPAVMGAVRGARDAQVSAEINAMSQALASFKNEYGDFPPSRIMLSETGYYPVSSTQTLDQVTWFGNAQQLPQFGAATAGTPGEITVGQLAERSLRALRKFFPRAAFSPNPPATPTLVHDFNNNTQLDGFIYLSGDECLAFFLGGIPLNTNPNGLHGFNRLPINPFLTQPNGNYKESFFDFNANRLTDLDNDGMLSYIDILGEPTDGAPYAYFSTNLNGGSAYDPNDCNFGNPLTDVGRPFRRSTGTPLRSVFPNPYTQTDAFNPQASPVVPTRFWNPETFQIISAGRDKTFGMGGIFDGNNEVTPFPEKFDAPAAAPFPIFEAIIAQPLRDQEESDNIVNFHNGKLN